MNIKRRIWALPLISTIIFGLGIAVSAYIATGALHSIRTTEQVDYPVLDLVKSTTLDVSAVADTLRDAVSEGDKSRIAAVGEQANKLRSKLAELGKLDGQAATASRLRQEFDAYFAPALGAAKIMLEMEQGDPQATVARMQSTLATLNGDLAKTNSAAQAQFKNGIAHSEASVRSVVSAMVLAALIVVASLVLVSWFVVRAIWQQLGGEPEYARQIARAVADGDLSMEIVTDANDRTSMLSALKDMRAKLAQLMGDIKLSADTIQTASAEIASGNADLAARTESQAGSLDQTSRAMEKLTTTVRQNTAHANQANALVVDASSIATRGGQVVSGVVSTMGAIHDSAKKIVDIIAVIDGIAFQTNILALNAAVEAARAGEQGRGFAVVASEVRNLAQRSASAAKEIKQLIGDSVAKVDAGAILVDQAGTTMDQIVASVKKVADIMVEISTASFEQNAGIEYVGHAIASIDQMTQQNSALVEEASAAAESLSEQTSQLSAALAVFKLSDAAAPAAALALR
ncbi:methyl-accepting chemotaxis protein [Massilia sp. PWRC2]|uniref:methyl-accepting chemotaxis protein n=1 Tax=Massilia sp. PWRC2 TaxID=2804626 RepID=UPI003CE77484